MHVEDLAILKSLVAVAWVDGKFADEEKELLEALLSAFNASDAEADEVRTFAKEPRSLADIPITDLSADDRLTLLNHAVVLTYIDSEQSDAEKALLVDLVAALRIPAEQAGPIILAAEARVKRLLQITA